MKNGYSSKVSVSVGTRVTNELREFAVIATYLSVCFTALAYLKATILEAHGIAFAPFGFAVVKALLCAKFVLVGRALHVGERFKTMPLIWPTLHKSVAFLVLLLVLNLLEEIVLGLIHHRTLIDSIAEIGGGTIDQLIATSFVVLLTLIPFFAFRSLGEVVGERNLVRVFFTARHSVDNP
jgi:hypothetical protein